MRYDSPMTSRAARPIYARANVDITAQLASLPTAAVDADTLATLTKISNWISASTENAGTLVAQLLVEHRGEEAIVKSAHDLLGELAVIRQSAVLVEMVLARLHVPAEKSGIQQG